MLLLAICKQKACDPALHPKVIDTQGCTQGRRCYCLDRRGMTEFAQCSISIRNKPIFTRIMIFENLTCCFGRGILN